MLSRSLRDYAPGVDEQASFEPKAVLATRRAGWPVAIVPALALAATAWLGLSGANSSRPGPAHPSDAPVAVASVAPGAGVPKYPPHRADSGYPSTVLGLDVQAIDDLRRYPPRDDLTIAIAGWYVAASASACPVSNDLEQLGFATQLGVDARVSTFCRRSGLLLASSPGAVAQRGAVDAAMPVVVTPGIVLPPALDDIGGDATRAVLVGRLGANRACLRCPLEAGLPWRLHVDRVAWAAGLARAPATSILPSLLDPGPVHVPPPPGAVADPSIGATDAILMETLVDPSTLAAVDPDAADVVAAKSPPSERIWYRRALAADPAHEAPRWVAIDGATGEVIGSGSIGPAERG